MAEKKAETTGKRLPPPEVRVAGIEPALHAWEARVLPLNDTRGKCGTQYTAGTGNSQEKYF